MNKVTSIYLFSLFNVKIEISTFKKGNKECKNIDLNHKEKY